MVVDGFSLQVFTELFEQFASTLEQETENFFVQTICVPYPLLFIGRRQNRGLCVRVEIIPVGHLLPLAAEVLRCLNHQYVYVCPLLIRNP